MTSHTSPIILRRAVVADAALLSALAARTLYDAFGPQTDPVNMAVHLEKTFNLAQTTAELSDATCTFFIAETQGLPVGYFKLRQHPAPECVTGPQPLQLQRIYARREWLGQGVGATLMQGAIDEAQRQNFRTLWLTTWDENPRAIRFYQKWGFQHVGHHPFEFGRQVTLDWVMVRATVLSDCLIGV